MSTSPIAPGPLGVLGPLRCRLGLGLLRLSTEGRPAESEALGVIQHALDHGVRVLDTADVYALDDQERHHGERLLRRALSGWRGPHDEVRVLTKVGLTRPRGRWLPNGRPEHLREAVARSLDALGVQRIFLLQLHAHDRRVPFEETLAALAELQRAGLVEHLGLCNTSLGEVRQAERHFRVASVQNELSVLERRSAADGLLELTRELGIPFLAHRPLGGRPRKVRLEKSLVLRPLAERHRVTPQQIALAALLEAAPQVVPLVGATRIESLRSSLAAGEVPLDISDRTALALKYSFAASAPALAALAPPPAASVSVVTLEAGRGPGGGPEVVVLMGIQGAGKSQLVVDYERSGYLRLNRDLAGGKLDDLVPRLAGLLARGERRVVLDNTYPTRLSRAPVIAAARAQGVPVRCRFLQTPLVEAQVNVVLRMIERHGQLLGPVEMKALARADPTLPPPVAMTIWSKSFEPPSLDEGFAAVDLIPFERRVDPRHTEKGLLLDVDGTLRRTRSGEPYPRTPDDVELLPGRRATLARWLEAGYRLFLVSNQSGIAAGKVSAELVEAAFARTAVLLQLPVTEVLYCPHPAYPVGCFCRKPMPGLGVALIERHRLDRRALIVVGDLASDRAFAAALGARYFEAATFFSLHGPAADARLVSAAVRE